MYGSLEDWPFHSASMLIMAFWQEKKERFQVATFSYRKSSKVTFTFIYIEHTCTM